MEPQLREKLKKAIFALFLIICKSQCSAPRQLCNELSVEMSTHFLKWEKEKEEVWVLYKFYQ